MTDSNRDRDEAARDRDEDARDRDDLARREDAFSQKATKAARSVQTWATVVVILMVAGLFYLIGQEQNRIEDLNESASQTQMAAERTEQVLLDILEDQRSPENQEFTQAIRDAVNDLNDVKEILCDVDEPPEACQ